MGTVQILQKVCRPLLVCLVLAAVCSRVRAFNADVPDWNDDFREASATFFANTWDPWQMSMGHCQYGHLAKGHCTGWDGVAVADKNWDFNKLGTRSNCGACYEVRCKNGDVEDGYGETFDRRMCYDTTKTVVVQTIDLCECQYAANAYSNMRWCCAQPQKKNGQPRQHLDLTVWAFEKLLPKEFGVGLIEYRQVPCDYRSPNPAYSPTGETPMNPNELAVSQNLVTDSRQCGSNRRRRPTTPKPPPRRTPPKKGGSGGGGGSNVSIGRWSINSWTGTGINGRTATACGTLLPWGGFTFQGSLQKRKALDVWVKKEGGKLPNLVFRVEGSGGCKRSRHINRVTKNGNQRGYVRLRISLRGMGCKGVYKVVLQNNIGNWGWQNVCIDSVKAL